MSFMDSLRNAANSYMEHSIYEFEKALRNASDQQVLNKYYNTDEPRTLEIIERELRRRGISY